MSPSHVLSQKGYSSWLDRNKEVTSPSWAVSGLTTESDRATAL